MTEPNSSSYNCIAYIVITHIHSLHACNKFSFYVHMQEIVVSIEPTAQSYQVHFQKRSLLGVTPVTFTILPLFELQDQLGNEGERENHEKQEERSFQPQNWCREVALLRRPSSNNFPLIFFLPTYTIHWKGLGTRLSNNCLEQPFYELLYRGIQ